LIKKIGGLRTGSKGEGNEKKKMEFYPQGVRRLNLSVNGQKHYEGE
jgi:hypothetical protein